MCLLHLLQTLDKNTSAGLREQLEVFEPLRADAIAGRHAPRIEYEWAGIMGFSADGQPLIGPVRSSEQLPSFSGECE